jgi:RNA polymerase sigma-70 factor (ECF subfamily)
LPSTHLGAPATDRELVLAFQAGDESAYDEIYKRYRCVAERVCRRLAANTDDVQELTQETMLRVFQGLATFNGRYAVQAWVARIAANVSVDALRTKARRPLNGAQLTEDCEHDVAPQEDPSEVIERLERQGHVRGLLEGLPEKYRRALVLREFEGCSHEQIAHVLGVSAPQAKALLHRAKRAFRKAWAAEGRRSGLLGLLPPLAAPVRFLRRVFIEPVERATSTMHSFPSAATVAAGGERVTAAVTALMVGAVGVGVAAAPHFSSKGSTEKPPPAVAPAYVPDLTEVQSPDVAGHRVRKHGAHKQAPEVIVAAEPVPVAETGEEGTEPAPADGTAPAEEDSDKAPVPDPSSSASPEPIPHPTGFTALLTSNVTASGPCGCGTFPSVLDDNVSVSEASGVGTFSNRIVGAAIADATGQAAWSVDLRQWGHGSSHSMEFYVSTIDGTSPYQGSGAMVARTELAWGGWEYTYSGTYERRGGPMEHGDLPQRGRYTATLTFSYKEHRLVAASFSLQEDG